jgi:hypothetical protein
MASTNKPERMLLLSDLTRAEKLYLRRRRLGLTQVEMSVDHGVSLNEYRAMEADLPGVRVPYAPLGTLTDQETYVILRQRSGLSKPEVAEDIGVSPYWLRQMESGAAPIKRLEEYWRANQ